MNKLYSFLVAVLISGTISAQCTVTALSYIWPDTSNINSCFQLGDTLVIDATNSVVATQLDNDFELGTFGNGWQTGLSANVIINDPTHCAWPPPANPTPNLAYVWMGNAAAHPRNLTSVDFDLSQCFNLEFDMKYATQSQAGPCEGPDLYCEGVRIQYSTDAGVTWFNWDGTQEQSWSPTGSGLPDALTGNCATHPVYAYNSTGYWDPDTNNVGGSAASPYVNWFHVNAALPLAAQTTSTRIRWIQLSSSSNAFDHWGLDNVKIGCQAFAPGTFSWYGGAAVDTILPNLPQGGLHLLTPTILGNYTWVVEYIDSSVMNTQGVNQPSICYDTVHFIGMSNFDYNVNNVSCYGDSNGIINVDQLDNSSTIYSFSINGILNTNPQPYDTVFTNLGPGTYGISISDNGNCEIVDSIVINAPNFPLQLSSASDSLYLCYGDSSGSAYAVTTGGTPFYSYEWFDGSYTPIGLGDSISGLLGGSYFVKVTDANGCDTVGTLQVLQMQTPLLGTNQIFGVPCKGDSSGMIVSQATGSQGPYHYDWLDVSGTILSSSSQPTMGRDTLYNLVSGTYNLQLFDAYGCTNNYTITVGEPSDALSIDSVILSNSVSCFGDNDGAAQTYISGGMPNYYYVWDNGELNSNAVNLTAGFHVVSLTDDWGCVVEDSIFIPENSEIETTILLDSEVSCYGFSDGSVSATSVGGVPNYSYFWSNGSTDIGVSTTNSGLIYGSYYLTTQDIYGCEVFDSILVGQPDPLYVEATEIDSISCYGYDDGLASASAWGGTPPYVYYWDSLSGFSGDTNNMLTPGVHLVYVVDSRGCIATDTVLTHEPPVFEVNILDDQTILAYCIGVNSASLTSLANGGTPPYWYSWDDNSVTPQTTVTASNLLAGVYTITVTDYRGCVVTDTRDIDTITNTMSSTIFDPVSYNGSYHVSCYGENDGMLYVVGGGSVHLPLTYQWYGPNGFSSINDSIIDLIAGTYSVTVKDSNNCSVNNSFDISSPDLLEYTIPSVLRNESCEGSCNGQLNVILTGGTFPYVGVSTEVNTGVQLSSTLIGDSILGGLCSGTWNVILTDDNGCSSSLMFGGISQQMVDYNNQTSSIVNQSTLVNVLCYGTSTGSLDVLSPHPNTINYSYNWVNALTGTSVGTGFSVSNLPAGTYVLESEYSDNLNFGLPYDGCTTRDTIVITEISEINSQEQITDVDCFDNNTGSITVSPPNGGITGGTSPYTLQWNPGGMGGTTINNLVEGTYTLSVTDNNACVKIDTFVVNQPNVLLVTISQNGATLTATVSGGILGYTYRWKEVSSSSVLQGSSTYMVLNYGTYYCEIEDANGCITASNEFIYSPTSIDFTDLDLSIYPNPFRDRTTVDFGRTIVDGEVKVIDILGNIVEIYELDNQRELVIERTTKSTGIYFVEIIINNNKIFKKITLQ